MITMNNNEFVENLERALSLIEEQDYQVAMQFLNNAIEIYDQYEHKENDLDLTYLLNLAGNISMLTGNTDTARTYFEKALNLDPASSLACSGLGDILYISGNYEAAKTMYEWGLKNDPANKAASEGLSKVNAKLNPPQNENKAENTVYRESENDADKLIKEAYELFNSDKFQDALQKLLQAERLFNGRLNNPSDIGFASSFHNMKGFIYLVLNDIDNAKACFEKALNLDPNSSQACAGLGEILFLTEHDGQAKTMFEWAVKNNPDNSMAVGGLKKINDKLGYQDNHSSLDESQNDADALKLQSTLNEILDSAFELFGMKHFNEALSTLERTKKIFYSQENKNLVSAYENIKGMNYLGLNLNENARECFETALNLNPASSQACAGLGEILFLTENDEQAKIMFEWAVKNNPDNLFAVGGLKKINNLLGYPDNHSSLEEQSSESRQIIDVKIIHRDELGKLFNKLGLFGKGIEIGVQEGIFSKTLRSSWNGEELYLIDRWKYDPEYKDIANVSDAKQKEYYLSVVQKFSEDSSVQILRKDSLSAANQFPDGYFDWIYIDADHSFEGCSKDLAAWYPKLRPGGVFAGHDYIDGEFTAGSFGVKSAVDNFVNNKNVKLFITEETYWKSWYFVKPSPDKGGTKIQTSQNKGKMSDADSKKLVSMLNEILEASFELFGLKNFNEAIDTLKKAQNIFYSQESKELIAAYENLLGFNFLGLDKKEQAKESFENALNMYPQSSQACAGLGEIFYLEGKDKEAKTMYEYAVKNNPDNLFAIGGLEKINKLMGLSVDDNSLIK